MIKKYFVLLAVAFNISFSFATAQTILAPEGQKQGKVERNDIEAIISQKAREFGVNEKVLTSIVMCESSMNPNAINNNIPVEYSVGLVQLNLLVHDITEEQAKDPNFAVSYLANKIVEGKADRMWVTCYKKAISL